MTSGKGLRFDWVPFTSSITMQNTMTKTKEMKVRPPTKRTGTDLNTRAPSERKLRQGRSIVALQ